MGALQAAECCINEDFKDTLKKKTSGETSYGNSSYTNSSYVSTSVTVSSDVNSDKSDNDNTEADEADNENGNVGTVSNGEKIISDGADGGSLGFTFLSPLNEDFIFDRSSSRNIFGVHQ